MNGTRSSFMRQVRRYVRLAEKRRKSLVSQVILMRSVYVHTLVLDGKSDAEIQSELAWVDGFLRREYGVVDKLWLAASTQERLSVPLTELIEEKRLQKLTESLVRNRKYRR